MKVSVLMITYNHEKYISQAIESVLSQKTDFDFELIIANDCSTDDSDGIIKSYLKQNTHIKYYSHQENIGMHLNFKFAFSKATGDYIALCEGDDYWIDDLKLQKQVDFLEAYSNYSLCFTRFNTFNEKTKVLSLDFNQKYFSEIDSKAFIDFDFKKFYKGWHIGNQTLMFRNAFFYIQKTNEFKYFRDAHLIAMLLKEGKGACLNFVGATYRIHDEGIHSSVSKYDGFRIGYETYKEIYLSNPSNQFLKKKYVSWFRNFINANIQEGYLFKAFKMSIQLFIINWSFIEFLKNLKRILTKAIKN
ncbi:glycosyltransferase [Yeosuana sp. MJ-SS3]|uniref:Glycosyltransferase n=1 Tax=Gilvirhabdus luticola TaxID=3079858 RepID=A0ABU3U502_9FLAO|nr:glycosyltransferase [Yeosuana sp. MJ-SS3]MDU8885482.1 glycosyltransferase [Yeosuana sp. MJ-SS3]